MLPFQKAKWIWENDAPRPDEYAEFVVRFSCDKQKKQTLLISADSDYAVYRGETLVAFGQYACYPDEKFGDAIDVSPFLTDGENELTVLVWYYGVNSMTYKIGQAGVIFEIVEDGAVLACSSEETPSRPATGYVSHKEKLITSQLGLAYEYDALDTEKPLTPSVAVSGIPAEIRPRPIAKTVLRPRSSSTRVMGGTYHLAETTDAPAEDMARAALTFRRALRDEIPGDAFSVRSHDGAPVYFIVDLGKEESGFLDFDLIVPCDCRVMIGYGEHLRDGRVRTYKRNFTAVYHAHAGRNVFLNPFRRFGCRYLQFFIDATEVNVAYAGIRPVEYPVTDRPIQTGNLLRDTIREACVRTLKLCMHEHYEDCPWREQALYAMDSRNQALAGYVAFGETAFPRASFRMMASHPREDGLLCLCAPGGSDAPIPSFSCAFFPAVKEYLDVTGDLSLAEECLPAMRGILAAFRAKKQENGLSLNFYAPAPSPYWNFYEWSPTMDGRFGETEPSYECPLNAFYSIALANFAVICDRLGLTEEAARTRDEVKALNETIVRAFYRPQDRLFDSFLDRHAGTYSVLTNALCVLCGAADTVDPTVIAEILAANGAAGTGLSVVPNTLSMNLYRFDAMLRLDEANAQAILNEIDRVYLGMLREGATTFWETLKGDLDFDTVGSLCHGWSALPLYYYDRLHG